MKNPNENEPDSNKMTLSDKLITISYIITIVGLFIRFYDHGSNHDLSVSIGSLIIVIVVAYYIDHNSKTFLSKPLSKFLIIINRFMTSPIFIVGIGSVIVLLFLARILKFADII